MLYFLNTALCTLALLFKAEKLNTLWVFFYFFFDITVVVMGIFHKCFCSLFGHVIRSDVPTCFVTSGPVACLSQWNVSTSGMGLMTQKNYTGAKVFSVWIWGVAVRRFPHPSTPVPIRTWGRTEQGAPIRPTQQSLACSDWCNHFTTHHH